jgi:hypothetical protein
MRVVIDASIVICGDPRLLQAVATIKAGDVVHVYGPPVD